MILHYHGDLMFSRIFAKYFIPIFSYSFFSDMVLSGVLSFQLPVRNITFPAILIS